MMACILVVEEDVKPILGLPELRAFGYIKESEEAKLWYFEDEKFEIDELESLPPCNYVLDVKLEDGAKPIIIPPRQIPLKIRDLVKTELDRMEKLGVISPVNEP